MYKRQGAQDVIEEEKTGDRPSGIDDSTEEYFSPESSERYLTAEEISAMSDYEKLAVMYEIAARHGATFMNVDGKNTLTVRSGIRRLRLSKKWMITS